MTDEERARLAEYQRDFGRMVARVKFSRDRMLLRLEAMLAGKEPPPVNPMELTDAEWDDVRLECEAWDMVLARQREGGE